MTAALLSVRVARKAFETPQICRFELVAAPGVSLPPFAAGAHIDVHTASGLIRQYSLCNNPSESHRYVIGVLRDPASRGGSVELVDKLNAGDILQISAPRNHFPLIESVPHSLLLAGGIGITPLLCMAERLAAQAASFEFHYCVRSHASAAFLERMAASSFAARLHLHCDDGPLAQRADFAKLLADVRADTHLYVCGPSGFMDAVLAAARAADWPESQLHWEYFAASTTTDKTASHSFELQLASSGKVLSVPADRSAAQVLIDAGINVALSCEQGICGSCLTPVLDGIPEHRDMFLTPAERAANDQFTPCCSRARTQRLVLDL
jgi:vanillate O-demethylase ferredoxin subunit